MKPTKTDREQSIEANEYLWDTSSDAEVHQYVGPILNKWLANKAGEKLLDIGCGNGALTAKLAALGLDCSGTDFSESGIQIAQTTFPSITFFQSTISEPLPDKCQGVYDIVTSVEVIEHLLLPRELFARAKEALKPGGTLIVTTPYHGYLKNIVLALTNKFDSHWHPLRDYGHVKFFSPSTLGNLFEEQGFSVTGFERVGRIPPFARSMICKASLT